VQEQIAPSGERPVDDRFLKHDAADSTGLSRLLRNIEASQSRGTARRLDRRGQHADRGRLSRTVRPEQAEYLARSYLEVDPFDGLHAAWIRLT
jgi:hypothetical protein